MIPWSGREQTSIQAREASRGTWDNTGLTNEEQGHLYLCQLLDVCADLLFLVGASSLEVDPRHWGEIRAPVT
jgi:hypothetical protein